MQQLNCIYFRWGGWGGYAVLMVSAPVVLTEPPAAAAESPAAEPPEPQPEAVAESGKTVDAPRLERETGQTQTCSLFSLLTMFHLTQVFLITASLPSFLLTLFGLLIMIMANFTHMKKILLFFYALPSGVSVMAAEEHDHDHTLTVSLLCFLPLSCLLACSHANSRSSVGLRSCFPQVSVAHPLPSYWWRHRLVCCCPVHSSQRSWCQGQSV